MTTAVFPEKSIDAVSAAVYNKNADTVSILIQIEGEKNYEKALFHIAGSFTDSLVHGLREQ